MHNSPGELNNSLKKQTFFDKHDDELEYDDMELLERLETLREDMEDLKVSTLSELIRRIEELHRKLDDEQ